MVVCWLNNHKVGCSSSQSVIEGRDLNTALLETAAFKQLVLNEWRFTPYKSLTLLIRSICFLEIPRSICFLETATTNC